MGTDKSGDEELLDGSPLCLECGLCCHGVLHHYAVLKEEEVEAAEALGLSVERDRDYLGFALPCPKIDVTRCTIYEQRLSTCSGYRCGVLHRYQRREIALDDALTVVGQAKQLFQAAMAVLPPGKTFREMRSDWRWGSRGEEVREGDAAERAKFQLSFLRIAMLDRFLDRHVRMKHEQAFEAPKEEGPATDEGPSAVP